MGESGDASGEGGAAGHPGMEGEMPHEGPFLPSAGTEYRRNS